MTPRVDPGFQGFMEWRELDDKPADEVAAKDFLKAMIAGRVERLEEMIALHEEIEGEEAIELADAASFEPGPTGEKYASTRRRRSRELRQTLELFLKMQAAAERRKKLTTEGTEERKEETTGQDRCERSQSRVEPPTVKGGAKLTTEDTRARREDVRRGRPRSHPGARSIGGRSGRGRREGRLDHGWHGAHGWDGKRGGGVQGGCRESAGSPEPRPRQGQGTLSRKGVERKGTEGVQDVQAAQKNVTNEAAVKMIQDLVKRRFAEMLGKI